MFRWLKDRGRKGRKPSISDSLHSKEDDYGFKQQQARAVEYKRDLPPTPADLMTSCNVTDDDKSLHIYEEIPDLPFRCTPEGELRINLTREEASRRGSHNSAVSLPGSQNSAARNISPYMVVPLERLQGTPSEFQAMPRAAEFRSQQDTSFACAVVGQKRADGCVETGNQVTSSPSCESTCSPSCCGSSVFGSPLDVVGRCGYADGESGDISDRLLSAINLTRLLAAVRLSSSSADTCTTSPICIGVDKDGRNISVSVSVTPTAPTPVSNHHHSHHHDIDHDDLGEHDGIADHSNSTVDTKIGSIDPPQKVAPKSETGLVSQSDPGLTLKPETGFAGEGETGLAAHNNRQPKTETVPHVQPTQTGLRFLPSPQEQTALSEILQLRPGESTELDPATIDALILKLCSHTLHGDGSSAPGKTSSSLQGAELERVEKMLREMVKGGEADQDDDMAANTHQPSPKARRAENSDTGYEYDVSTSSESDQTNYDYFLSKVAHTRSLECQVKKLIRSSDSSHADSEEEEDDEEEEEEGDVSETGESFTTVSTVSPTSHTPQRQRLSPEVESTTADSDEGTMADLSESENSSGYYESGPGQHMEPFSAVPCRGASKSAKSHNREKKAFSNAASDKRDELSDLEVQCFELDCREADDILTGVQSQPGVVAGDYSPSCLTPLYSQLSDTARTMAAPACLTASANARPSHVKTGKGKCSGMCKKPRHYSHHHHHHHHRSLSDSQGEKERRKDGNKRGKKSGDLEDSLIHVHSLSVCDTEVSVPSTSGSQSRTGNVNDVPTHPVPGSAAPTRSKSGKTRSSSSKHSSKDSTHPKATHKTGKPNDYPYSFLYHTTTSPHSRSQLKPMKAPKTLADLERASSLRSEQSTSDGVYESRHQGSEVYSIPAALPDPGGGDGGGVRGLKGSVSVPSKLCVARQVPDSSEVYGTRAGLRGCNNNRLLSDLIMLNYNRQVLNM